MPTGYPVLVRPAADEFSEFLREVIGRARESAQETVLASEELKEESSALVSDFRKTASDARDTRLRRLDSTRR